MKITEKEKQAIKKYAELIECKWFDFATDENGNDCVLDKDSNKKLELRQGIDELKFFDSDLLDIVIHVNSPVKIIEEDSTMYYYISSIEKKTKLSASMERFLKKYPLKVAQTLLSEEEQEICNEVFDLARRSRIVNRGRAIEILQKVIKHTEQVEGKSILKSELNKEFDITAEEYDYIFNSNYYR